ncbi:hypothetical protein ACG0Z6_03780 [Roseateles sp. BYS180W]|uniref:Uncharacterized protein n=1 Tax=Roseateles rivi TaxID=3299028 RepID=A0ABW7FSQ3_9BURK
MPQLHPHLIGFLEGLCAASVTRYPEYGMYLRGPTYGEEAPQPTKSESANSEALKSFFVCALSNTSASRPQEATYVVERFLELIQRFHPDAALHCEIPETRGWFDGLDVWLTAPTGVTHFFLDWSVS